jgi:DNA primase large subunit
VPGLVERRRVFLQGGWAYVPAMDQANIIYHEFETRLQKVLEVGLILFHTTDRDANISLRSPRVCSPVWMKMTGFYPF